jgi:hypothetical protein
MPTSHVPATPAILAARLSKLPGVERVEAAENYGVMRACVYTDRDSRVDIGSTPDGWEVASYLLRNYVDATGAIIPMHVQALQPVEPVAGAAVKRPANVSEVVAWAIAWTDGYATASDLNAGA